MGGDCDPSISIDARPLRRHLLSGIVHHKMPVLVDLRVKLPQKELSQVDESTRPAFELSIVLDRSGSMGGDKLAKCKLAIHHILDNLTAQDLVHFVIYDDQVETVFSNGNISQREELKSRVQSIHVGGCTDLHAGMVRGFEVMRNHQPSGNQDQPPRQKRIFLFSDGLANSGVQDHDAIFQKASAIRDNGTKISTFGVGTDFDEKLMKGIAEYGCGDYMYIEQSQDIEKKVAKALHGLVSMVGTEARIFFRGLGGSLVERIHGNDDECLSKGVLLRDLRENDWKRLVLFMEVRPPADVTPSTPCEILSYRLVYKKTQSDELITTEGCVAVEFTQDEAKSKEEDSIVTAAVAVTESAAMDRQVLEELEKGNKAEAIRLKKQAVQLLQDRTITGDVSGAMRDRALMTLQKLESDIPMEQARKEVGWDVYAEEEDCDMGYALFD